MNNFNSLGLHPDMLPSIETTVKHRPSQLMMGVDFDTQFEVRTAEFKEARINWLADAQTPENYNKYYLSLFALIELLEVL